MSKSNEKLSLPQNEKIHGIEIKKMPCGRYMAALQTLKDLPENFVKEVLSDNKKIKLSELFEIENLTDMLMKLLILMPDFIFKFLSELMDIKEEILREKLSPKELLEIIIKFFEINELESFFDQMKPIMKKVLMLIGFKKQ